MKADKNFKLSKDVKRRLAAPSMTQKYRSVYKKLMINAQLHAMQAANAKVREKLVDTDS